MFRSYLKTAFRNILKHKTSSFISILGLAAGIVCCSIVTLFLVEELSYDRYHSGHEQVYRVAQDIINPTSTRSFANVACTVGPALKDNYPQVEKAARICRLGENLVTYEDRTFMEDGRFCADSDIFGILSIPFVKGDPATALERPTTVVLTEQIAGKYFGSEDPVGKTLRMGTTDYEITGVVQNPPTNTHWKYNMIISMPTLYKYEDLMSNWFATQVQTYIRLAPAADVNAFKSQMRHLADGYVGEQLKEWGTVYEYSLQPLANIHLHSNLLGEFEAPGNLTTLIVFGIIGLLVLLVACMNFINLATARASYRAREVGLRKVVGAHRTQLIGQFLGESMLTAMIALLISVAALELVRPIVNDFTGMQLTSGSLLSIGTLGLIAAVAIVAGLAGGVYPALALSSYSPIQTLKYVTPSGSSKSPLRRILVVFQFGVSMALIILTVFAVRQIDYMKNQPLGFDTEQQLVIPLRGVSDIENRYESIKAEFLQQPGVQLATVSSSVPGEGLSNFSVNLVGAGEDRRQDMNHFYFDPDFIPNYDLKLIAGRAFDPALVTDQGHAFMINRAALAHFGWQSPDEAIGQILRTGYGGRESAIIGVTENFHYRGLQSEVEPVVMEWLPEMFRTVTLTVATDNLDRTLAGIGDTWSRISPNYPLEYSFLDDSFALQYADDERTARMFSYFAALAILIAGIGLFGLSLFFAQQRTKEIGIRKVLGSSVAGIVTLIARSLLGWVLLACVLACPLAYFAVESWLDQYAYRIGTDWLTFGLSSLAVLVVATLTISLHTIRAARVNPVECLKNE